MPNYLKLAINFALSNILKDLRNVENKALVKADAKTTIKDLEKLGFNAVFKLERSVYDVMAFDLNTVEKTWQIQNGESIKELLRGGKIDNITFLQNNEIVSVLIADYEFAIDYGTGIITAVGEYDGDLYTVYFENGKEESCEFGTELGVEFYGAAERAADMFGNWESQVAYDQRNALREQNNSESVANHM